MFNCVTRKQKKYIQLLYGKLVQDQKIKHSDWFLSSPNFGIRTAKIDHSRINFSNSFSETLNKRKPVSALSKKYIFASCLVDNFGFINFYESGLKLMQVYA